MKTQIISAIEQHKLIAIVRGAAPEKCLRVAQALYDGGIRLMEITYDQKHPETWKDTANAIGALAKSFEGKLWVGAGTVTCPELVELTAEAGGLFVISPDTNEDVIRRANELGLVSIPGALTPTEIQTAHRAGADFVKLFPVTGLGTEYVKAISAPLSHIKFLAVGGLDENNMAAYLKAGVCGFGIGSGLANRELIEAENYGAITELAKKYVAVIEHG